MHPIELALGSGASSVSAGQTPILWAWLDLNQRPHPYQQSWAHRCAERRFPRSLPTVRGEVMRSNNLASGLRTDALHVAAGKVCDTPRRRQGDGLPGGRGSPIERRNRDCDCGQAAWPTRALRLPVWWLERFLPELFRHSRAVSQTRGTACRDINGIAFSRDGRLLATAGNDGSVVVWDLTRRVPIGHPLRPGGYSVIAVAFSPDGRTLASGVDRDSGAVVLTRVSDGTLLYELGGPGTSALAFSRDGRTLAAATLDGRVRLWDPAPVRRAARRGPRRVDRC